MVLLWSDELQEDWKFLHMINFGAQVWMKSINIKAFGYYSENSVLENIICHFSAALVTQVRTLHLTLEEILQNWSLLTQNIVNKKHSY